MLTTINNDITMTRGDSFIGDITLFNEVTREAYVPGPGDRIVFELKKDKLNNKVLVTKDIDPNLLVLELEMSDTATLPVNSVYLYDIYLLKNQNGKTYKDTFIDNAKFKLV